MGAALAKLPYGGEQPIVRLIGVPSRPTTHRNANGAQAGSEFRLGNAWTRHHHFFAGAGEGDITRPTLHRVAPLDRLRHVVGLVASVLRSFERPISATSVGILRPHFGRQVRRGVGDRRARAGRSDDRSLLEGFCWRTYHQARAARSDDDGGLSGVRRVTLKPRRESPLSIADSRQPG